VARPSSGGSSGSSIGVDAIKPLEEKPGSFGWRVRDIEGSAGQRSGAVAYRSSFMRTEVGVSQGSKGAVATAEIEGSVATLGGGVFFANRIDLFPSTKQVLQELRQMNPPLRLGLATSSVSASARPFLDRHKLTPFFEVIVTGEEVERGKPHPDIYLRAAEKLDVATDACLAIEDSLSGIAAAKAANMRVAAIPDTRFVDPGEYERDANYVLGSLKEIPALIRNGGQVAFH